MIDTHCHLTYEPLASDPEGVLGRARAAALASRHEGVFASVGLHPQLAAEWTDQAALVEAMQRVATLPRVVALGEMGLDHHHPEPPLEAQRRAFAWQLGLMTQLDLPAIIHNRQATPDVIGIIKASGLPGSRFVFHCFTGTDAELDAILSLGAMVSFTGIVTFKSAAALAASAARVPLDRLMIETDAPYLTPEPHRKVKVNEPAYVPYVARFLAERRGMSEAEFTAAADANAERFFRLPHGERAAQGEK